MIERVSGSSAAPWVPADAALEQLRTAAQDCRGCELYRGATQAVIGEGSTPARLMLLGEQPGDREDIAGEPFVGPAGGVLHRALAEAGIDPDATFTTNVVKHFRFHVSGKRRIPDSPGRAHVAACRPWLAAELALVRPAGVVLLGATAGKALYGSSFKVGEARGVRRPWPADQPVTDADAPWVVATIHPSAVLRAREDRDAAYAGLVADLRVAASLI